MRPTDPTQRNEALDMVRGFALFGVLLVNMFNFGATWPIWTRPVDTFTLSLMQIFFETKSFRLFSFLFGFGIALQLSRVNEHGAALLPFYLRRVAMLFILGMVNCLLYDGDVLMLYAEFGIILLLFRTAPASILLTGWLVLNLVFPVQRAITALTEGPQEEISTQARVEQARIRQNELANTHPYSVGSVSDVMALNAEAIPPNPLNETSFLGMCLLGLYAGRRQILQRQERYRQLIKRVCYWGLSLGLIAMAVQRLLQYSAGYSAFGPQRATVLPQLVGDLCLMFGATALSLGYAGLIVLLAENQRIRGILRPLGAVGKFSLSIYLIQTLMFSTLFYGYGFGQSGRIGPAAVAMYAVLFFLCQIWLAVWWARRYRFGPMEWLWRSFSYWKTEPIRRNVQENPGF